ncbi:uncharacterized protein At2g02148-like [Argentina anserina]|uniref:uncharacterized protein At2g02148-like n=1 Tax=Argentina anserina TaxID=57926 RepID=UPI0021765C0C|nr:uncharacterized protein At2g02148-like [Potentilla anserina]
MGSRLDSIAAADAVDNDVLDNDDDSSAVVSNCIHESFSNSLPIHGFGVDNERSSLDNDGSSSSRATYDILCLQDVSPIESSRARFLQLVVNHFISEHVIEAIDSEVSGGSDYSAQSGQDKLCKRKLGEVQLEGDPRFALPLMYIANMYETLVNDVDNRLASLGGFREKSIGVALEPAGGLYRLLAKKFSKKDPSLVQTPETPEQVSTRKSLHVQDMDEENVKADYNDLGPLTPLGEQKGDNEMKSEKEDEIKILMKNGSDR